MVLLEVSGLNQLHHTGILDLKRGGKEMKFWQKRTFLIIHTVITIFLVGIIIAQDTRVKVPYYIWRLRHYSYNADEDYPKAVEIMSKLAKVGKPVVNYLPALLNDKNPDFRLYGIGILYGTIHYNAIPGITAKLKDPSPLVRAKAADFLQEISIPNSSCVISLLDLLEDENKLRLMEDGLRGNRAIVLLIRLLGEEFRLDWKACKSEEERKDIIKKYKARFQ